MNKRDWAWLIIRTCGLILLYRVVVAVPAALASFLYLRAIDGQPLRVQMEAVSVTSLISAAVYLAVSLYLLLGGRWIHGIMCQPE